MHPTSSATPLSPQFYRFASIISRFVCTKCHFISTFFSSPSFPSHSSSFSSYRRRAGVGRSYTRQLPLEPCIRRWVEAQQFKQFDQMPSASTPQFTPLELIGRRHMHDAPLLDEDDQKFQHFASEYEFEDNTEDETVRLL